jgi:hypothetical protein
MLYRSALLAGLDGADPRPIAQAYEQLGLARRDQGRERPDLLLSRGDAAAVGGDPLRARLSYVLGVVQTIQR